MTLIVPEYVLKQRQAKAKAEKEAKDILTGAFKEMGYDGFLVSELHPQRYAQYIDGIVIFDNKKMKHVDADHFDGEVDAMFYSARENNFNSLNGAIINEMVQKGKTLKPSDYVYVGSKGETEFGFTSIVKCNPSITGAAKIKDVVTDFYNNVDYDSDDIVKEVETTIDKVSLQHNVKTDVMYNYIDKETGLE